MADGPVPMWKPDEVIHEGAEATVTGGFWMGNRAVLKVRRPRGYRHPDLDRRLTRQRLAAEARILSRLSSEGFPSPALMFLDQRSSSILMSRIEGSPLHDLLKSGDAGTLHLTRLGSLIRCLHEVGVSHGDLTTHNVMVSPGGNLYLIDFGLSRQSPELEHLGLDLQVLNECLGASHSLVPDGMEIVCDGYLSVDSEESEAETAIDVVERFRKITGRVRYHG
ncbi:MAG: Kae1-associated kinase Bud32 [Euryarchaeota archaeon]|nr:Kae1-associated kinase Bud32 [Euryarchaeota archaeon]